VTATGFTSAVPSLPCLRESKQAKNEACTAQWLFVAPLITACYTLGSRLPECPLADETAGGRGLHFQVQSEGAQAGKFSVV
jgi:hypothetical protein